MTGRRPTRFAALVSLAVAPLLAAALSGCSTTIVEPNQSGAVLTPPSADSPTAVVQLLRWAYVNRSPEVYGTLFTSDFVFVFAASDSAGNAYRLVPWTGVDEGISAQNLFVTGKGSEEPATSITLEFANSLVDVADPRPGRDPGWHRLVNADLVMVVKRPSGEVEIKGAARFFVVRGDSADIIVPLGATAPADRWYIERWEDDTAQSGVPVPGALAPLPANPASWGRLKSLYR